MRLNLTSIFILTGFFVACGGTGDNFADSGDEGGFGGTPNTDGSSGDEAFQTVDGSQPGKDATTGACSSTCTSNAFCESACGTASTYCCDIATGACYPASLAMCPATIPDSGTDTMPY